MTDRRLSWDDYFMMLAETAALRSNCSRRAVGAVAVVDGRVVSTGYNGTPSGVKNCFEGGCPRCASDTPSGKGLEECICVHAEQNVVAQAARHGIGINNSTVYVTLCPCLTCAKIMVSAGVREIVYGGSYPLEGQALALLKEAGVAVRKIKQMPGFVPDDRR